MANRRTMGTPTAECHRYVMCAINLSQATIVIVSCNVFRVEKMTVLKIYKSHILLGTRLVSLIGA